MTYITHETYITYMNNINHKYIICVDYKDTHYIKS